MSDCESVLPALVQMKETTAMLCKKLRGIKVRIFARIRGMFHIELLLYRYLLYMLICSYFKVF